MPLLSGFTLEWVPLPIFTHRLVDAWGIIFVRGGVCVWGVCVCVCVCVFWGGGGVSALQLSSCEDPVLVTNQSFV